MNAPAETLDALNASLREALVASGTFYIVQTVLHNQRFLRASIMNPRTTEADLHALLDEIEQLALARQSR